jgi:hypothetical protein
MLQLIRQPVCVLIGDPIVAIPNGPRDIVVQSATLSRKAFAGLSIKVGAAREPLAKKRPCFFAA